MKEAGNTLICSMIVVLGLSAAVAFLVGYTYLMYLIVSALQKYIGS